jgi:hypothetical protein
MSVPEPSPPPTFAPEAAARLALNGWASYDLPSGLTLATLREQGAPFRGERFFHQFAAQVVETPTTARQVAFRPAWLAGSRNRPFADGAALVEAFGQTAPPGTRAIVGTAATYVWLFWQWLRSGRPFPLAGAYTWTSDQYPEGHLIVGWFGQDRPIVVAPHPKFGAGIGVSPLLVPAFR